MTEPQNDRPLLIFPGSEHFEERENTGLTSRSRAFGRRPSASQQGDRLGGQWTAIEDAMQQQTTSLSPELGGADPELVLVIEIIDDVEDFYRAVVRIEGFEFLAEIDEEGLQAGEVFLDRDGETSVFPGTLFLMASNQAALNQVLQLWNLWLADENQRFPQNLGRWKEVFRLLHDVRRWSPQDRLRGTGALEDFAERVAQGQEIVTTEIELWFRNDATRRSVAEQRVAELVSDAGGATLSTSNIAEIGYHAVLAELPIEAINPLFEENGEIALIQADEIAFLRPEAQAVATVPVENEPNPPFDADNGPSAEVPRVAVLDGLPLAGHLLLNGWVQIDDPDGWEASIQAGQRRHGTAITSLVVHGDGNDRSESLESPVYVRPILRPDPNSPNATESVPHGVLAVDLVFRAVVRMLSPDGGVAQSVKIVNLSIGDRSRPFALGMSPWARLIDYLSYKYGLLFVISAGNHSYPIEFSMPLSQTEAATPAALRTATIDALIGTASNRRLLSPSEAVNSLAIGASHHDSCGDEWVAGARRDLMPSAGDPLPSPISAVGMGYRRSIKPDLLAPGGRVMHRLAPKNGEPSKTVAESRASDLAPGLRVASPSSVAGSLSGTRHFHGTSGAAALVSHSAGRAVEVLESLTDAEGNPIDEDYLGVLAKAICVHSSIVPASTSEYQAKFGHLRPERQKDALNRFFGYGVLNAERATRCSASRATMLGWGSLVREESDRFAIPLPPSLSGSTVDRKLRITLAYFSPLRMRDRRHRAAQLYFRPDESKLGVHRLDADWRTVRRGTVQHEVLGGTAAAAFLDGDSMALNINCRSVVGAIDEAVPYALAVTIEAAEIARLPIYDEIAERLREQTRSRVRQ